MYVFILNLYLFFENKLCNFKNRKICIVFLKSFSIFPFFKIQEWNNWKTVNKDTDSQLTDPELHSQSKFCKEERDILIE
jgi:hypothetical protein